MWEGVGEHFTDEQLGSGVIVVGVKFCSLSRQTSRHVQVSISSNLFSHVTLASLDHLKNLKVTVFLR